MEREEHEGSMDGEEHESSMEAGEEPDTDMRIIAGRREDGLPVSRPRAAPIRDCLEEQELWPQLTYAFRTTIGGWNRIGPGRSSDHLGTIRTGCLDTKEKETAGPLGEDGAALWQGCRKEEDASHRTGGSWTIKDSMGNSCWAVDRGATLKPSGGEESRRRPLDEKREAEEEMLIQ